MPVSKLPDVATTIFSVVSRRAADLGALNVGQGFPDYAIDPRLAELAHAAMVAGHNQYAPTDGISRLRRLITARLNSRYDCSIDADSDVTITCGATEALYCAIQAVVGPRDEVIVFDPAYDSYDPAVRLAGGRAIHLPLEPPHFRIDWQRVREAITPRTRLVILNSPHNPSCTMIDRADMLELASLLQRHDLLLLSDEVYEPVVFDARQHCSALGIREVRERAFVVFSFGKSLHATGWRTGYCVAPSALMKEFRKVHQFNTFSIAAPIQEAIADFLEERPDYIDQLAGFFQRKRDILLAGLGGCGLAIEPAAGTYFQLLDFSPFGEGDDLLWTERLLIEAKVALIPLSAFYADGRRTALLRICCAKRDETLHLAADRIRSFLAGAARRGSGV
ncbi:MAG: methionine aminotransferase [Steroidobacteraceae bacterium]